MNPRILFLSQNASVCILLRSSVSIELEDESVDCVLLTEVLEHCPEPRIVLAEVYRVLRRPGLVFMTVPFLWPLHEVPFDEVRYTPFCLRRHFEQAGFVRLLRLA